jgi:amino acid permease
LFGIISGFLSIRLKNKVLIQIIATSFIGSFLFCCGIGLVIGHYENPFTIGEAVYYNPKTSIDPLFYAYFAWNIIIFSFGIIFQLRQVKNENNNNKETFINI